MVVGCSNVPAAQALGLGGEGGLGSAWRGQGSVPVCLSSATGMFPEWI